MPQCTHSNAPGALCWQLSIPTSWLHALVLLWETFSVICAVTNGHWGCHKQRALLGLYTAVLPKNMQWPWQACRLCAVAQRSTALRTQLLMVLVVG